MTTFINSAEKFTHWCRMRALPYWAQNSLDPNGGGYEYLHMDGSPGADSLRRVRVQARQAYVYAHAGALGWYDDAKSVSDHYWEYLITAGFQGGESLKIDGFTGCAHLLNPDGSLHDGMRDTYAQAFVILAGAWRYIAFQDELSLRIAKQTLQFLDNYVKAQNGGWLEGISAALPRRQNPHMHLFEALLSLYDATQDVSYLKRASEIFELFKNAFFDEEHGTVIEFFNQDWSRAKNGGGPIEPGHMMEWCWLLWEYEKRSGVQTAQYANRLYDGAKRYGLCPNLGLLYDAVNLGAPPNDNPTMRTWVQTEFLKASLARAEASQTETQKQEMRAQAGGIIETMFDTYLNVPALGGWGDRLDKDGILISPNMPASTFYHFFCAAAAVHAHL